VIDRWDSIQRNYTGAKRLNPPIPDDVKQEAVRKFCEGVTVVEWES
jgi:hypothetical protein